MGQDSDILTLAWLNSQPGGFAYADEIPGTADLTLLESNGFIVRVPGREPGERYGYVITPAGKRYQEGD